MIEQVYTPYWTWECYKLGMWERVGIDGFDIKLSRAIKFMSDVDSFHKAMYKAVFSWDNSMLNFLTNKSINRVAYVGQCAVFYEQKIEESVTRSAWKELPERVRVNADKCALMVIREWEKKHKKELRDMSGFGSKDVTKRAYQTRLL